MVKGRVAFVATVIATACALVLGYSSSTASARGMARSTEIVLIGTSPAQVTAGQTFTITFGLARSEVPRHIIAVGCFALAGGKVAQVVDMGTDGSVAHCTWAIPRRTKGKTFDGNVSAQADSGTWYNAGFDVPIH
jgi:hypothetical protein